MTDTSAGYLTDLPYIPQFHREHAPVWLRACLAALGRPGPGADSSSTAWCEVGCGPAVGLLILAATNPGIRFHGLDINPDHIADARQLAEEAGIGNAEFHCIDLLRQDLVRAAGLPEFDFVLVRGLYSWVSPDVRQSVRQFVDDYLKPQGVALLHYLTLPGAADLTAFHGLFNALRLKSDSSAQQVAERGRDLVEALRRNKAGFFATHPVAAQQAAQIAADEIAYTAHDYLNAFYTPLTVTQVMHDMSARGLTLAGSANPLDNLDDFTVPENVRGLLQAEPDPGVRELIRDFAGNQVSRLDLYRKSTSPLTAAQHFGALRQLRFRALPDAPARGGIAFETRIGRVEGHASIFSPVLEMFAARSTVTYAELEQLPTMRQRPGLVNQTLHALMGGGVVHPVPDRMPDVDVARQLNAILVRRHAQGRIVPGLAVPEIGSGLPVPVPLLDRLAAGERLADSWDRLLV